MVYIGVPWYNIIGITMCRSGLMTEEAAPTQETPHSQAWLTSSLSSVAKLDCLCLQISLAMVLLLVSMTVVMVFVDNNNGDIGNADEIKLTNWWL